MTDMGQLHDRACMSYWWPAVDESGLRSPRTWMLELDHHLQVEPLRDGLDVEREAEFERLCVWASDIIAVYGAPMFLRTGHTSAKHEWKRSCFVASNPDIGYHVTAIVEYSEMASFLGPRLGTNVWAVREVIDTEPLFYAFAGMPITREFRFFVEDGQVSHIQPYWPPNSIDGNTSDLDWGQKLGRASVLDGHESELLRMWSCRVASHLEGDWSVDWLQDCDGQWWLTDMAPAELSFRWDPSEAQGPSEHAEIQEAAKELIQEASDE